MMKSIKRKQDDQSLLIQGVTSQVTIQGERLREIEIEVSEVKDFVKKTSVFLQTSTNPFQDTKDKDLIIETVKEESRKCMKGSQEAFIEIASKGEISLAKEITLDVKSFVKGEIEYLMASENFNFSEITSRINKLENLMNSGLSDITTFNDSETQVMPIIHEEVKSLDDKVARLTKLILFTNTKFPWAGNWVMF